MSKQQKQVTPKKSKKWIIPLVGVLALGAGGGAGYAISTLTAKKTNPEVEKAHEIVIPEETQEGYLIACDKKNAKMGDVVTFTVSKNSNEEKVPKAIRLFATNTKGEEVSSDYPLVSDGVGGYYATVTITYISNMRTELVFEQTTQVVVSFDTNGGSVVDPISVDEGGYIQAPANPTKDHYTFSHWQTKQGDAFDFEHTPISGNMTLYAVWNINKYTVTWKNEDGSVLETDTDVPYGKMPVYLGSTPTKAKTAQFTYVFDGWNKQITPVQSDTEYKATYRTITNKYVVTFDANSGSAVAPVTTEYGSKISSPTTTREGYTFLGWYIGDTSTKWDFSTNTVTEDVTLKAHWEINKFTVSFDTDGGSQAPSAITNVEWNSVVPAEQEPEAPTKTRCTFEGWYVNGQQFIFGTTKVTSNITLVAKWATVDAYSVMFNTNGGTIINSQTVYKGELATKPSNPTKTGYTFKNWYNKPQTDDTAVVFDFANTPITGDTTIYAHWNVCSTNVSFVDCVAKKSIKTISVEYGQTIKSSDLPSTTKAGYEFIGWSKQMTKYDPYDISQPITDVTQNISIYMYYEPVTVTGIEILTLPTKSTYHLETTQTQTLDLTGLSVKMIHSYGDPTTVTDFSTGWTNSGFVTTSLGEKTVKLTHTDSTKSISFKVNIVNQFTSLAVTQQPTTISYGQGGTFTPKGLKVQLTDYEGTAQTEVEWTTDSITEHQAKGYTITAPDMSTVGNKEVTVTYGTLTAKFPITVTDVMYTVTFNVNDAGASSSTFTQIVKKGDKIVEPAEPTSTTGKIWLGWYVDQSGTALYDFSQTVTSQPSTIYGKWEESACFNGVRWGTVVNACNVYESIENPTLDQAKMLCRALNVDASDQTGTAAQCLENKLVGKTGKISINGKLHAVRCIGTNHDTIQGSTKTATLTLELANVLCDSDGNALHSLWDLKANLNRSYTTSVLYKNLVGTDDQASWYGSSETRTAWQMLLQGNLELAAGIKTVEKQTSLTENYTVSTYNTKLFPLTNYEMNRVNSSYYNKEGAKYDKFYTSSTTTSPVASLIKKDIKGSAQYYWTASPRIDQYNEEEVYIVTNDGYVGRGNDYLAIFNQTIGVSFAFCI